MAITYTFINGFSRKSSYFLVEEDQETATELSEKPDRIQASTSGRYLQAGDMNIESPRVVCRYGAGCTHTDRAHKEQYWHPAVKDFSAEQVRIPP